MRFTEKAKAAFFLLRSFVETDRLYKWSINQLLPCRSSLEGWITDRREQASKWSRPEESRRRNELDHNLKVLFLKRKVFKNRFFFPSLESFRLLDPLYSYSCHVRRQVRCKLTGDAAGDHHHSPLQ